MLRRFLGECIQDVWCPFDPPHRHVCFSITVAAMSSLDPCPRHPISIPVASTGVWLLSMVSRRAQSLVNGATYIPLAVDLCHGGICMLFYHGGQGYSDLLYRLTTPACAQQTSPYFLAELGRDSYCYPTCDTLSTVTGTLNKLLQPPLSATESLQTYDVLRTFSIFQPSALDIWTHQPRHSSVLVTIHLN